MRSKPFCLLTHGIDRSRQPMDDCSLPQKKLQHDTRRVLRFNNSEGFGSCQTGEMDCSQDVELFVKAGRDGATYGACPICHTVFLALLYRAESGVLSFTLSPINALKPPDDLRYIANRLPALSHAGEIYKDEQVILDYLNFAFPNVKLPNGGRKASAATLHFYGKFSFYMRDVSHKPNQLLNELAKLDRFLAGDGGPGTEEDPAPGKFLNGDNWTALDMGVLSKLQHVRVACKALKGLEIPTEYCNLWRYLHNAYHTEIFRKSCPSDEEIIYVWGQKVTSIADCPKAVRHIVQNTLESDASKTYSFDVPPEVLQ